MMTLSSNRLMHDFKSFQHNHPEGIQALPDEDNIHIWSGHIEGPKGTPWEGGNIVLIQIRNI